MKLEVDGVLPVDETLSPLPDGAEIIALAGIGSPARFYDTLSGMGYRIVRKVEIGDHEKADISLLLQAEKDYPLVMTEKDFVKYAGCGLKNSYYVPVSADLPENFYGELLSKVKRLSAGK